MALCCVDYTGFFHFSDTIRRHVKFFHSYVSIFLEYHKKTDQFLNGTWTVDEHICKTVASCMNKLIQINRIKHLLDKETLLLIINSFVFSRLFYCSSVWSNTLATNIHKL